jgi:RIO kinase 1
MNNFDLINELDDLEQIDNLINKSQRREKYPPRNPKKLLVPDEKFVRTQDDSRKNCQFTYKAARFEEWWLLDSLGDFYEHKWISDVLRRVKGGKEASVYLCRAGAEVKADYIAAKVYRPRSLRNLHNDGMYREGRSDLDDEGRQIIDDGMSHAMQKKTEYGRQLLHQSWIAYEYTTMEELFAAGADVPEPYTMAHNAILMGYIGDSGGCAPTLSEISLERREAKTLFDRVVRNIDNLLAHERIHGDLSAYNILYWEGDITLIDFPQTVSPKVNRNAFAIFLRDVTRVCDYFSKMGVSTNPGKLAVELWKSHGYRLSPEVDVRLLDAEDPEDRAFWDRRRQRQ